MYKELLFLSVLVFTLLIWIYLCYKFTNVNPVIEMKPKEKTALGRFKEIMSQIADCSTAQYLPDLEDAADDFNSRYYGTISNDERAHYYDNMCEEIERRRRQLNGHSIIRSAVG